MLRLALLLMRSPGWLWRHYPQRLQHWCVHQWMLQFGSYRRYLDRQGT